MMGASVYLERVTPVVYGLCSVPIREVGEFTPAEHMVMITAMKDRVERDQFAAEMRNARLMALIANLMIGTTEANYISPMQFMPDFPGKDYQDQPEPVDIVMTDDEMEATLKMTDGIYKAARGDIDR